MADNKKRYFAIGALVLVLAIGGYYYFSKNESDQVNYLTESVTRGDVHKTILASGTVRSSNRVEVGAQISGQLNKIYVSLGDKVKKGDLLAEIDSTTQTNALNTDKAKLKSYQSQLKSAQVTYEIALSAYNRNQKLYKLKSTSLDSYNSAKQTLASAQATVDELKSNIIQTEISVQTAEIDLGYTKITAPIDGTVISIPVSVGQTVNANQTTPTIVQIADLNTMLIKPEISEGDITEIKLGQHVKFTILSMPNEIFHGVIKSVDPATSTLTDDEYSESVSDTDAIYYYANVLVDNPNNILRIGMTTEDTIEVANAKNVLIVSNMALKQKGENYFVNVLDENEQPQQRAVKIGVQNDFQTEITSGLNEGDKVIISEVKAGEKVGSSRIPKPF